MSSHIKSARLWTLKYPGTHFCYSCSRSRQQSTVERPRRSYNNASALLKKVIEKKCLSLQWLLPFNLLRDLVSATGEDTLTCKKKRIILKNNCERSQFLLTLCPISYLILQIHSQSHNEETSVVFGKKWKVIVKSLRSLIKSTATSYEFWRETWCAWDMPIQLDYFICLKCV